MEEERFLRKNGEEIKHLNPAQVFSCKINIYEHTATSTLQTHNPVIYRPTEELKGLKPVGKEQTEMQPG